MIEMKNPEVWTKEEAEENFKQKEQEEKIFSGNSFEHNNKKVLTLSTLFNSVLNQFDKESMINDSL